MRIDGLPMFVCLPMVAGAAMMAPAAHAFAMGELYVASTFFNYGLLTAFLSLMIAITLWGKAFGNVTQNGLAFLIFSYFLLPPILAIPLWQGIEGMGFVDAWFEMVSALTTTGMTIFDGSAGLPGPIAEAPDSIHVWRATVAWIGGFMVWLAAISILPDMNFGGFEAVMEQRGLRSDIIGYQAGGPTLSSKMLGCCKLLFPVYLLLTAALLSGLLALGDSFTSALVHSMSTLSTSGITVPGGLGGSGSGVWGEGLIFLFLALALSRTVYLAWLPNVAGGLWKDPEIRIGLALVLVFSVSSFFLHLHARNFQAFDARDIGALRDLWGTVFTGMSFLTTAGFESAGWLRAEDDSILAVTGLFLAFLALVGGGVATTAGGLKLFRVYSLYVHGMGELQKLVYPSSINSSVTRASYLSRHNTYMSWLFFMVFTLSLAATMLALAFLEIDFTDALGLSMAAISTTGPAAEAAVGHNIDYLSLSGAAKTVLCAAMVMGRLETLVFIALLNPSMWRA